MPEAEAVQLLGPMAGSRIRKEIEEDLRAFGVEFDNWYSERSLYERGEVARTLEDLEDRGSAYRSEGALWLRTTAHGDEKDRVLVRDDGRETYFASDIAYHLEKFARGFDEVVDIWGADHHGYMPRVRAALAACGVDASTAARAPGAVRGASARRPAGQHVHPLGRVRHPGRGA